jgi:hypothetical protein
MPVQAIMNMAELAASKQIHRDLELPFTLSSMPAAIKFPGRRFEC